MMNVQTKTNQDEQKGLVYNHDESQSPGNSHHYIQQAYLKNMDNSMLSPTA